MVKIFIHKMNRLLKFKRNKLKINLVNMRFKIIKKLNNIHIFR